MTKCKCKNCRCEWDGKCEDCHCKCDGNCKECTCDKERAEDETYE